MSILGTIARLPADLFHEIRQMDGSAQVALMTLDYSRFALDLDKSWDGIGFLLEQSGAPVNIIRGGSPFPHAANGEEFRSFTPQEVAICDAYLRDTSFTFLIPLFERTSSLEVPLYPRNRDSATAARLIAPVYESLRHFVALAASQEEYCVS